MASSEGVWNCVYTLDSISPNKVLRVLSFENNYNTTPFVDIRVICNKRFTKNGVCLRPNEFKYLIKVIRCDKMVGKIENNGRQLAIKNTSGMYTICLETTNKTSMVCLNLKEIQELRRRRANIFKHLAAIKEDKSKPMSKKDNQQADNHPVDEEEEEEEDMDVDDDEISDMEID